MTSEALNRQDVFYQALSLLLLVAFFVGVPLLLVSRVRRPRWTPWWLVVAGAAALGWVIPWLRAAISKQEWEIWTQQHPFAFADPPFQLPLPLGIGCLLGVAYLLLWLVPYCFWRWWRRQRT